MWKVAETASGGDVGPGVPAGMRGAQPGSPTVGWHHCSVGSHRDFRFLLFLAESPLMILCVRVLRSAHLFSNYIIS